MPRSHLVLFVALTASLAGCRTAPDYALDAEVQAQRAKEAEAVDAMKGAFIKPTTDFQETDAGRIRSAK